MDREFPFFRILSIILSKNVKLLTLPCSVEWIEHYGTIAVLGDWIYWVNCSQLNFLMYWRSGPEKWDLPENCPLLRTLAVFYYYYYLFTYVAHCDSYISMDAICFFPFLAPPRKRGAKEHRGTYKNYTRCEQTITISSARHQPESRTSTWTKLSESFIPWNFPWRAPLLWWCC